MSVVTAGEAVAALVTSLLLVVFSFRAVFFIQFVVMTIAIPIAFLLKEPPIPVTVEKRKSILAIIKFALHENKRLLYLNIFAGIISTTTLVMVWFAQPYWNELGVNIVYFGVMWAGLNLLVSISALYAHKVEQYVSFRTLFFVFAVAPLLLYGSVSLGIGLYALFVIPLFWVLRGVSTPITLDYINRETDSSIRATVISVSKLFSRLFFSVVSPFLGWVADIWSLETAFQVSALIFGFLSVFSFALLYRKMRGTTI